MAMFGEGNSLLDEVIFGEKKIWTSVIFVDPERVMQNLPELIAGIEASERRGGWQDQQLAERYWAKG